MWGSGFTFCGIDPVEQTVLLCCDDLVRGLGFRFEKLGFRALISRLGSSVSGFGFRGWGLGLVV